MAQVITVNRQQARPAPRLVRALAQFRRRLTRELFDAYHPERHYMRGPGPAWRAKHETEAKRASA